MYMAEPFLGKGIGKPHRFSDGRPFAVGKMRGCSPTRRRKQVRRVGVGGQRPIRRALLGTFAALGKSHTTVPCAVGQSLHPRREARIIRPVSCATRLSLHSRREPGINSWSVKANACQPLPSRQAVTPSPKGKAFVAKLKRYPLRSYLDLSGQWAATITP